jgi:hypothetical protein
MSLDMARKVADAVLYEGYLLYPYRATSRKNQIRWQFGVAGPPGAAAAGIGEDSRLFADCLARLSSGAQVTVHVRFLQLQTRTAEQLDGSGFTPVAELLVDSSHWLSWDEAVECERVLGPYQVGDLAEPMREPVTVAADRIVEELRDSAGSLIGRLVRRREQLSAALEIRAQHVDGLVRLSLGLENTAPPQPDKRSAIGVSLIGAHLLLHIEDGEFVSTVNPPDDAGTAAAGCRQHRWWPVLAGPATESQTLLVSPIIVEDHAELAAESAGALFDSTEIDEILTLRVMTMTDAEKAEARATDPRAAEIIDRCDAMTPQQLQNLHGVLRHPHSVSDCGPSDYGPSDHGIAATTGQDPFELPDDLVWDAASEQHPVFTTDEPWWHPEADASVEPETDGVTIAGVTVRKGSLVTVHPNRRADAHDIFFSGMTAKVAAVLRDVDGDTHVAVTLVDDPAAEMHDWYGRYLYFAPDELIPNAVAADPDHRKES